MKSIFHNVNALFTLPLFTVLGLAIFLGGCNYTHSKSLAMKSSSSELSASTETESKQTSLLSSKRFRESSEFEWTSPPNSKEYNGPQNARELMKVFDGDYNSGHLKTEVNAFRKVAGIKIENYSSKLTLREIDTRYPRAEWLQMLLDRGITIKDFPTYSKYLLKRHTLALIEDNPKLRQFGILDIPPINNWKTYKEVYINRLVNDHTKHWETMKQVERSKKEIEHAKTQIERSKEQWQRDIEHHKEEIEHAKAQMKHAMEQFERIQKEVNAHAKKEAERAIERSKKEIERAKAQIEHSKEQWQRDIERSKAEIERAKTQIEHIQKTLEHPQKTSLLRG